MTYKDMFVQGQLSTSLSFHVWIMTVVTGQVSGPPMLRAGANLWVDLPPDSIILDPVAPARIGPNITLTCKVGRGSGFGFKDLPGWERPTSANNRVEERWSHLYWHRGWSRWALMPGVHTRHFKAGHISQWWRTKFRWNKIHYWQFLHRWKGLGKHFRNQLTKKLAAGGFLRKCQNCMFCIQKQCLR